MKKFIYAILAIMITSPLVYATTTYTTNYTLAKPGVGDTGWGANVSANFDTIDTQLKSNADAITNYSSDTKTLTNKTIDGDDNTIQDLPYSSIKSTSRTGLDAKLVTGTPGSTDDCAKWDDNGDLVSSGASCGSGGGGGGSTVTLKVGGTIEQSGTFTIDLDGSQFQSTESPTDEENVSIKDIYVLNTGDTMTGQLFANVTGALTGNASTATTASATPFSGLTGSTNTTAAMVVGSGASLGVSGSGTISATDVACTGCVGTTDISDGTIAIADMSASGTPSSSTFLRGDNSWATPAGSGDVTGPGSSTDNAIVRFNGTSGTSIQNSAVTIDDSNNITTAGTLTAGAVVTSGSGDSILSTSGSFDIGGTGNTNNELLHMDFEIVANKLTLSSTTGLATIDYGSIAADYDSATVTLSTVLGAVDVGGATSLEIPNGASGTTDAVGEVYLDNNAWATGRGAIQVYDGTANTLLIGALSSDTPTNGQVPKWNTGGTITWEDDTTGAGSGAFSDASDPVVLNTTTKDVAIGSALINSAKLSVDGDADQVQFALQAHSTQNANMIEVENSGGTVQFALNNFGVFTTWHGGILGDSDAILFDNVNVYGSGNDLTVDGSIIASGDVFVPNDAYNATTWNGDLSAPTKDAIRDKIETISGGGSSTQSIVIPVGSMSITGTIALTGDATTGATLDSSNGRTLLFDNTTDQGAAYRFKLPSNWSAHGSVKIDYSMTSATSGTVEWEAAYMCVSDGDSIRDDADSFAAFGVASETVPGTVRFPSSVSITPTDDGCAAGDTMTINISTDADDGTNDTATGTRRLIGVVYEYTAS